MPWDLEYEVERHQQLGSERGNSSIRDHLRPITNFAFSSSHPTVLYKVLNHRWKTVCALCCVGHSQAQFLRITEKDSDLVLSFSVVRPCPLRSLAKLKCFSKSFLAFQLLTVIVYQANFLNQYLLSLALKNSQRNVSSKNSWKDRPDSS